MAAEGDLQTQRKTYDKVLGMLKYGGVVVLILAFVIIYLISRR